MSKFRFGDRVIIKQGWDSFPSMYIGETGTISQVVSPETHLRYLYKITLDNNSLVLKAKHAWEDELEFIENSEIEKERLKRREEMFFLDPYGEENW